MKAVSEHEYGGIRFPGHEAPRQQKLTQSPGYRATELQVHPPVRQDLAALAEVLDPARGPLLGIDLEFKENLTPTIVSVTRPDLIWSAPWSPEVATKLQVAFTEGQYHWIAHSGIAADKPVIEKALSIKTPLDEWGDSLISHWLCNMHLCLRGDTGVVLPSGDMASIQYLVSSGYTGEVLSHAPDGTVVRGRVTAGYRNSRVGRRFISLSYLGARRGRRSIVTEDHPVLTLHRGYVKAGELQSGEEIYTGERGPNQQQLEVVTGMCYGDSYASALCFRIMNGPKQLEWLTFKAALLPWFFINEYRFKTYSKCIQQRSLTGPFQKFLLSAKATEFRDLPFTDRSLAVFYLDDGSWNSGYPGISVKSWSYKTKEHLLSKIQELGIPCSLRYNNGTIYFGAEGRERLLEVIAKYVPNSMLFKIGYRDREYVPLVENTTPVDFIAPCVVKKATARYKKYDNTVYCLEVEPHNNFVTAGGVVSNCKAPSKDETDDAGSLGFNSLWHMASLTTDLYNWKQCRGNNCDGPCRLHSPIDYCGLDAFAGLVGYQEHLRIMERRHLPVANYRQAMHLSDICYRMEMQGVAVDREFVAKANANFDTIKDALFEDNIFNPKSPKQVMEWFAAHGVQLRKTEKDTIKKALEKVAKKSNINLEELDSGLHLPPAVDALNRLYKFKSQGKGLDPWFADKYFGLDGLLHPRFIVPGTSTSRLSSSAPNFMNIPKRGAMAIARQAIIPRDPGMDIICPDVAQLELRMCLWYAGIDQSVIGEDAFNWLVSEAGGAFEEATKLVENKKARDLAKVASHGGDYMLGFKLLSPTELSSKRVQEEISAGALRGYTRKYMPRLKKDWTFKGKIVAFSGAKLAEMLYGNTSYDSRRKTHLILEDVYFNKFFAIREWQMRVLEFVETNGYVQSATGRFLQLYGTDYEEWAKVAIAFLGQGTSAEHVQAMMRRYDNEFGVIPLIQVHDELVFEIPRDWSDEYVMGPFIRPMVEELDVLPGFKVPVEVKRGPNWKQTRVLGKASA